MNDSFYANLMRSKFQHLLDQYWDANLKNERKREQIQQELAREFRLTKDDIRKILTEEGVFPRQNRPKNRIL